jgi:DNA (cytosine-5)-methyltransferase 1
MTRVIKAADLFCGAGGASEGLRRACDELGFRLELVCVNHNAVAISSHAANHPEANHLCTGVDNVNPRDVVPDGFLDVLWASPECTHHSNARGGKPMSDQSRATAWCVLRWAEALYIENVIIENVPEFMSWGPLGKNGRPIPSKKGELFKLFVTSLKRLGYTVSYKILCAADYGDPTTRRRFFLMAKRGRKSIVWPEPTHCDPKKLAVSLFSDLKPWVPARDVIDFSRPSQSIFDRKKPLAAKTLRRIYAGLERFGGPNARPFLIILRQHMSELGIDETLPTLTARGQHLALVEPILVNMKGKSTATSVESPCPTQTTNSHLYLAEPFILPHEMFKLDGADSIDSPLRTITATNGRGNRVVEPILVPNFGEREGQQPRASSVDGPLPTVTGHGAGALVEGCLIEYYGNGASQSVESPLPTVTTKDRFALITTAEETYRLDIRLRMLHWTELAAAMSIPGYILNGTIKQKVRQIGNMVPAEMAKALGRAALSKESSRSNAA